MVMKPSGFDSISKSSVFSVHENGTDVFTANYVPARLWHRRDEMESLMYYFSTLLTKPATSGRIVTLYGPVGTGKTVLARMFIRDLTIFFKRRQRPGNPVFKAFHINCRKTRTPHLVLTTLLRQLVPGFPLRGYSVDELLRMYTILITEQNLVVLLVLDEIDHLQPPERTELLYALSRLAETATRTEQPPKERFNLLVITRQSTLISSLDATTASSFGRNVIPFFPYTRTQLVDILQERARLGFLEGAVTNDLLDSIAGLVEDQGDARAAIELLWRAAKQAERDRQPRITLTHLQEANVPSLLPSERSTLDSLSIHQKILLYSIAKCLQESATPSATTPEIRTYYEQFCEKVGVRPRRQTQVWAYLKDLVRLGLIHQEVKNRHRDGSSLGRVTAISIREMPLPDILQRLHPVFHSVKQTMKQSKVINKARKKPKAPSPQYKHLQERFRNLEF